MSTTYFRIRLQVENSAASDYSGSVGTTFTETSTATEHVCNFHIDATTGGQSVPLSGLGSADNLIVNNHDETNFVTLVYRTNAGGATDQTVAIPAGKTVKLVDFDPATALSLTADTAACSVSIIAW